MPDNETTYKRKKTNLQMGSGSGIAGLNVDYG